MKADPNGADHRANQLNPHHPDYYLSRGFSLEDAQRLASEAAEKSRGEAQPGKPSLT